MTRPAPDRTASVATEAGRRRDGGWTDYAACAASNGERRDGDWRESGRRPSRYSSASGASSHGAGHHRLAYADISSPATLRSIHTRSSSRGRCVPSCRKM